MKIGQYTSIQMEKEIEKKNKKERSILANVGLVFGLYSD